MKTDKLIKPIKLGPVNVRFYYDRSRKIIINSKGIPVVEEKPISTNVEIEYNGIPVRVKVKCSKHDSFTKEKGRKMALKKAIDDLRYSVDISKEERTAIWNDYRTMTKKPRWNVKKK